MPEEPEEPVLMLSCRLPAVLSIINTETLSDCHEKEKN